MPAGGDEGFLVNGCWNPAMSKRGPGRGAAASILPESCVITELWGEAWSMGVCEQEEGARAA